MFFLLPLEFKGRPSSGTIPTANAAIIAVNVFFYLLMLCFGWTFPVGRGSGLSSILLYGFSHAGLWHIVMNMWVLWIFGNPVNRRLGNEYYALCYLTTIVVLGLIAKLFYYQAVVGASGGVFAVVVMACILMPSDKAIIGYATIFPLSLLVGLFNPPRYGIHWFIRYGIMNVNALWCLFLIPLMEIISLTLSFWSGPGGVWNLGHLLGMVCGLIAIVLLPTRITMKRRFAI